MQLTLFLDHDCNLRCDYCYGGRKLVRPMPLAVMERSVDLALAGRPLDLGISFFGGEPLLHPDLVAATVAYVESRARAVAPWTPLSFGMNTNGTLFDESTVRLLGPPRRWEVFVSLDGPAEDHDLHRKRADGGGSHAAVRTGLALLRRHGIPFHLLAVVGPDTARHLGRVLRALLDHQPQTVTLSPDLSARWTDTAIVELRAGLREAAEAWMETFRRNRPTTVDPFHTKVLTHLYGCLPCPPRCSLGGHELAVAPSGRLYPCAQMIGDDSNDLLAVGSVEAGLDRDKLADLQRQKDRVEATCAACMLRHRCESHCGCRHWALTHELGRIDATLCEIEESFIVAADHAATALLAENCPSFRATYYRRHYGRASGSQVLRLRRSGEG